MASTSSASKKDEVNHATNGEGVDVSNKGMVYRLIKKLFGCRLFYSHAKTGLMLISCQNISQE